MAVSVAYLLPTGLLLEVANGRLTQGPQWEGLLTTIQVELCTRLKNVGDNETTPGLENFYSFL